MNDNLVCLGGVGIIFLLVGLFVTLRAIKDWRRYRDSESWAAVPGQITTSNVTSHRSSKGGTTYGIFITYTYQVMGQSYQGNQFSFGSEGTRYGTRSKAEAMLSNYQIGSQATVYYDPNDPKQAVLEQKYDSTSAILGVIFGAIGIGMVIYSYLGIRCNQENRV